MYENMTIFLQLADCFLLQHSSSEIPTPLQGWFFYKITSRTRPALHDLVLTPAFTDLNSAGIDTSGRGISYLYSS